MNKNEYILYHAAVCQKMHAITRAKNEDYTGIGNDPFANFSRVESMGITDTMRGFLVRMCDKISRLVSFAQRGTFEVREESFEDTCLDLANYAILLSAYVKFRKSSGPTGGGLDNVKSFLPPNLTRSK